MKLVTFSCRGVGSIGKVVGSQVIDLLRGLADERRRSILLVTHDPAVAARADRIVRFRDGRVVDDAPVPGGEHVTGNLFAA